MRTAAEIRREVEARRGISGATLKFLDSDATVIIFEGERWEGLHAYAYYDDGAHIERLVLSDLEPYELRKAGLITDEEESIMREEHERAVNAIEEERERKLLERLKKKYEGGAQ